MRPLTSDIVLRSGTVMKGGTATADDIVTWSKERMGGYKHPGEVHIVDALPLSHVGKLDRKALRARLPVTASGN